MLRDYDFSVRMAMFLLGRFTISDVIFYSGLNRDIVNAAINECHELLEQVGERADGLEYRLSTRTELDELLAIVVRLQAIEHRQKVELPLNSTTVVIMGSLAGGTGTAINLAFISHSHTRAKTWGFLKHDGGTPDTDRILYVSGNGPIFSPLSRTDYLTLGEVAEGSLITGTPGSGKSSCINKNFAGVSGMTIQNSTISGTITDNTTANNAAVVTIGGSASTGTAANSGLPIFDRSTFGGHTSLVNSQAFTLARSGTGFTIAEGGSGGGTHGLSVPPRWRFDESTVEMAMC